MSHEKTEQGPAFPYSRREGSCAGHSMLSVTVTCGTEFCYWRAEPLWDSFLDFFVGVESVNHQGASSGGRQDGCHLRPSQVRSADVRTAATVLPSVGLWGDFALLGLWSTTLAVTDAQEAVSRSNEFLCWRQHSLITRCDKCTTNLHGDYVETVLCCRQHSLITRSDKCTTNLHGYYVETGSLFSRNEKNAVLDKTRQNTKTFSLSVRLSYAAILSSFGAKKKKASVVCTYKRSIASRSRNHCCSGKAICIT